MEEVTKELIDRYYKKYGGWFVTRGLVERKVRQEIGKRSSAIGRLIKERYLSDGLPIWFDLRKAQVTYSESRCLRTITIAEIAVEIMKSRKERGKG